MRILVVGSGGREHALVWKLRRSARVHEILCAPGNGGIEEVARCLQVSPLDQAGLLELANPGTIAPGSIGSLLANGLGSASANQVSLFPSTQSEGVQVTFNGEAARCFTCCPALLRSRSICRFLIIRVSRRGRH